MTFLQFIALLTDAEKEAAIRTTIAAYIGMAGGLIAIAKFVIDVVGARLRPDILVQFQPTVDSRSRGNLVFAISNIGTRPFTLAQVVCIRSRGVLLWGRLIGRNQSSYTLFDISNEKGVFDVLGPSTVRVEHFGQLHHMLTATHLKVNFRPRKTLFVRLPAEFKEFQEWTSGLLTLLQQRIPNCYAVEIDINGFLTIGEGNNCYGARPLDALLFGTRKEVAAYSAGELDLMPLAKFLVPFWIVCKGPDSKSVLQWDDRALGSNRMKLLRDELAKLRDKVPNVSRSK